MSRANPSHFTVFTSTLHTGVLSLSMSSVTDCTDSGGFLLAALALSLCAVRLDVCVLLHGPQRRAESDKWKSSFELRCECHQHCESLSSGPCCVSRVFFLPCLVKGKTIQGHSVPVFECPLLVVCLPCPSKAVSSHLTLMSNFLALNLSHVNKHPLDNTMKVLLVLLHEKGKGLENIPEHE